MVEPVFKDKVTFFFGNVIAISPSSEHQEAMDDIQAQLKAADLLK